MNTARASAGSNAHSATAPRILISAGEASGDLYASHLASALRQRFPEAEFFGCAGPRMRAAGVRPVIDAARLAVVGLVEVVTHIPGIYREYRRLIAAARQERPQLAILTDSPDFHLRLARRLKRLGVPVVYFIAPQAWAWRRGRVRALRRDVSRLLCIFPFEEEFFRNHGVRADYVGHPLTRIVRPSLSRAEFFARHNLPADRPLVALLPGSRRGEIGRHLPVLAETVPSIASQRPASFVLGTPAGGVPGAEASSRFWEPISRSPIQLVEGETWDLIASADVAVAASGTVTIEAALLGTPMVTYYRVTPLSWWLGRSLVKVPFLSMVNLVADKLVVPELIQDRLRPSRLAGETLRLLENGPDREKMKLELRAVAAALASREDPMQRAAQLAAEVLYEEVENAH